MATALPSLTVLSMRLLRSRPAATAVSRMAMATLTPAVTRTNLGPMPSDCFEVAWGLTEAPQRSRSRPAGRTGAKRGSSNTLWTSRAVRHGAAAAAHADDVGNGGQGHPTVRRPQVDGHAGHAEDDGGGLVLGEGDATGLADVQQS